MSDYRAAADLPIATILERFGRKVEAYRIARRFKQEDLAEKAGISTRTLGRLEAGGNGTLDTVLRILRALDIEDRLLDLIPDARTSPLDPRSESQPPRQRVRDTGPSPDAAWRWGEEDEA